MNQVISKPASQADVDNHVDGRVHHEQHVIDVATYEKQGWHMKFSEGMTVLKVYVQEKNNRISVQLMPW